MRAYSVLRGGFIGGLALMLSAGAAAAQEKLPDGLRHVPLDAMAFVHFRAGDFLKTAAGKELLQELQQDREAKKGLKKIEQTFGITAGDLESLTLVVLPPSRHFLAPFDAMPKMRMQPRFDELRPPPFDRPDFKIEPKELDKKPEEKNFDDKNGRGPVGGSPVSVSDPVFAQPFPPQRLDFQDDRFGPPGRGDMTPLVIVTSTKAIDRKKILKAQLFERQPREFGPPDVPSVLFVSDRSVMFGAPGELARYTELVARPKGPKTQPMKFALALAAEPHLVVAGGHVPPEVQQLAFMFPAEPHLLTAAAPLMQTDAALTIDVDKRIDVTLHLQAGNEASAALALQAVKTFRAMAELALEKGEGRAVAEWQQELLKAAPKALADATIEQKGTTVRAQLKMDVSPAFFKNVTKDIVAQIRQGGDRAVSVNNLKQIGLAIHNYAGVYAGKLPPAASSSVKNKDGKPLLSWRVAILPFIEQESLYRQFDLDQPWDHPTNKKLIAKMPAIYRIPGGDDKEGMTHYRTLVGPGAALTPMNVNGELRTRYKIGNIPDGTSNTIFVVEAREPTIWTRPDDLTFDPKGPLPRFGIHPDGFNVLLGDGSVRFLSSKISETTLRNAITADDGQPLGPDW